MPVSSGETFRLRGASGAAVSAATAAVAWAGQRLLVIVVVVEDHPHLDGLANVVGNRGVGVACCACDDLRIVGEPLVAEHRTAHPVGVVNARRVHSQRLAHLALFH